MKGTTFNNLSSLFCTCFGPELTSPVSSRLLVSCWCYIDISDLALIVCELQRFVIDRKWFRPLGGA
jgi:hypothetical protein